MQVACPQCGAAQEALTESRFYRCGYCGSAFILYAGHGILQYSIAGNRDDRRAWSALADTLEQNGSVTETDAAELTYRLVPYWGFRLASGETRLVPAVADLPAIAERVQLPAADLQFLRESPPELPTLPQEAALEKLPAGGEVQQSFLVFIPVSFLAWQAAGQQWQAAVCAVSGRVYTGQLPPLAVESISMRHLALLGGYALLLVVVGILVKPIVLRGAAFLLSFVIAWLAFRQLLAREV